MVPSNIDLKKKTIAGDFSRKIRYTPKQTTYHLMWKKITGLGKRAKQKLNNSILELSKNGLNFWKTILPKKQMRKLELR